MYIPKLFPGPESHRLITLKSLMQREMFIFFDEPYTGMLRDSNLPGFLTFLNKGHKMMRMTYFICSTL